MGMKDNLVTTAKKLLGDDIYALVRHHATVQRGLKEYGPQFEQADSGHRNILTCCPCHGNLGDQAIALAERRMLKRSHRKMLSFEGDTTELLGCFRHYVTPEDVIYLHGGGNMGTLYWGEEEQRLRLISAMRRNRIILFPQTMSYGDAAYDKRLLRRTQRVYGAHPDLHLFAREQVSFERMKAAYPGSDVHLVPDIVLSVSGEDDADFLARRGVLLCMRNDVEKNLDNYAGRFIEHIVSKSGQNWTYTDTMANRSVGISQDEGELLTRAKWDEFRSARLVITDRLHGMIFCAITGTPCVALDNANGKVGFEYEWLKNLPYIRFVQSVDEVQNEATSLMRINSTKFESDWFTHQFKSLTELIP